MKNVDTEEEFIEACRCRDPDGKGFISEANLRREMMKLGDKTDQLQTSAARPA